MNWEKQSEIKDILNERKWERRMETIGLALLGVAIIAILLMFLNAWYVSKQIEQQHLIDGKVLPRNDAQMLNGYNN